MFSSILYSSVASRDLDSGDLFEIIEASAKRNPWRDVTGFLIFDGREFLQYVEGPDAALDVLMETIARDRRHHSLRVLHRAPCDRRLFPKWAMRRAGSGAETELAAVCKVGRPSAMMAEIETFGSRRQAA